MSDFLLKNIYNACDPYKPATVEYYLDCAAVRGNQVVFDIGKAGSRASAVGSTERRCG